MCVLCRWNGCWCFGVSVLGRNSVIVVVLMVVSVVVIMNGVCGLNEVISLFSVGLMMKFMLNVVLSRLNIVECCCGGVMLVIIVLVGLNVVLVMLVSV